MTANVLYKHIFRISRLSLGSTNTWVIQGIPVSCRILDNQIIPVVLGVASVTNFTTKRKKKIEFSNLISFGLDD